MTGSGTSTGVREEGGQAAPVLGSRISPVAWIPDREMNIAEWARTGQRLGAMGRCGQWGIGDWLRYGNVKFGERYARAARITKYDVQTLMNMVYVAGRFEISRRRENLSWSHHETVACLAPAEQDLWLDRASGEKLSISDLRQEIRRSRRLCATNPAVPPSDKALEQGMLKITCPHCGQAVPLPSVLSKHVPATARVPTVAVG
jgi:hypothetical protein